MNRLAITDVAVRKDALPPTVETVVALTELRAGVGSANLRSILLADPGALLSFLALPQRLDLTELLPESDNDVEPALLTDLLEQLKRSSGREFADWSSPAARDADRVSRNIGRLARWLASRFQDASADRAEIAGRFAVLGRMVLASDLELLPAIERIDAAAVTRSLARRWRLPRWLAAILLGLDLNDDLAAEFGADRPLLRVIQAALALVKTRTAVPWLDLPPATSAALQSLQLNPEENAAIDSLITASAQPRADPDAPRTAELVWRLADLHNHGVGRIAVRRLPLEREAERLRSHLHRLQQEIDARIEQQKLCGLAEFAAGAGHEINNPLAVISAQAQQLLRDEENLGRAKALERIVSQSRRIHALLRDLMFYARPPKPKMKNANLARIVREAVDGQTGLAVERSVQLRTDGLTGRRLARIDEAMIETAIGCLVRNAVEAAPADGWVKVSLALASDNFWEIAVEDNGPGLTPQQRLHMFEPFYSGRTAGRGSGLGLSKAWRIAALHGGSIICSCELAQPTRVIFRLPANLANQARPRQTPAPATRRKNKRQTPRTPAENSTAHANGHNGLACENHSLTLP